MMNKITVSISMDYIIWMLDARPDELSDDEKLWVDTFIQLWKDENNDQSQMQDVS